ncbi:hypothetical protein LRAMOSA08412 [Lichtheimia ramosa]|uniref:Uncharacterized protein n=1 Tax=Lichtheimia ramosa TaxID=688394 RepID=A0A077WFH7_9FUNG|nr:hypothetical protein LRAMOSA08412 [Lichtheimia ramosa]
MQTDPAQEKLYWDEQIPSKNDHEFYAFPKEQVTTDDVIRAREALKRRQRRGIEKSILRTTAELEEFHYSFANQVDGAYLKGSRDHYYVTCSGTSFLKENSRSIAEKMARLKRMIAENKPEPASTTPASSSTSNTMDLEAVYRSKLEASRTCFMSKVLFSY